MPKVFQQLLFKSESVNEEKFTLEGVFSTADTDRHGDIVEQNWDLKHFKKNPVILNSHTYYDATEVVGKAVKIKVSKEGKLEGKLEFAVNENPKAKIIFDLYKGGFLNAFSVGFQVKEWDEKTGNITKSELLEISAVSVPANAFALAKSKGIDVDKLYENTAKNNKDEGDSKKKSSKKSDDHKDRKKESESKNGGSGEGDKNKNSGKNKVDKKEYDNAERWDEGDNEIRYKLRGLGEFVDDTFERKYLRQNLPGIKMTIGQKSKREYKNIQMLFFPKDQGWAIDDAKEYVVKNTEMLTTYREDVVLPEEVIEEKIINKNKNRFIKIQKAIELVGEGLKVEQSSEKIKAEKNMMVNKTIKKLIKLKE